MAGVRKHRRTRVQRAALGAVGGVIAAGAALAVGELVAALVRPESAPVRVVGGAVVDRTPTAVKDWAVRSFGSADKLVLQLGILVLLALSAVALGVLALRHRRAASAGVLLFGLIGTAAAVSRPRDEGLDWLPPTLGALAGAALLWWLTGPLLRPAPPRAAGRERPADEDRPADGAATTDDAAPRPADPDRPTGDTPPGPGVPAAAGASFDRRAFVLAASAAAAASAGTGLLARALLAGRRREAAAGRARITLPPPASPAGPVPRGARAPVPGVSPYLTPNADFYRVDTALTVPRVDAARWRLRVFGAGVSRPLTLGFRDLLARDLIARRITLTCVSNQVGGPYAGNAQWLGVPLAELLREAGVRPPSAGGPADQLIARSVDGMTLGTPVETVMDGRDALLAVGMNGEPLPFAHGFPVRMVVPGLYGYVSACKWLTEIELTTFDSYDAYWTRRGWAARAPVKTQSRIDTPRPLASLAAGRVQVAGVAWAQHTGIDRVQVRVDEGPWETARLAAEDGVDTWRQWSWEWPAAPGRHRLEVRATDRAGRTQTGERVGTVPDGATGWHSVVVNVS